MSVVLVGEKQLRARLLSLQGPRLPQMRQLGVSAVREEKLLVPRKTGNLGRTIHLSGVTSQSATTEASASYARAVEDGTRPHEIRARPGHSLFFASQKATTARFGGGAKLNFTKAGRLSTGSVRKFGNGAYVHAKVVHHPGTKAQPFMFPGAQKALEVSGLADVFVIIPWNKAA